MRHPDTLKAKSKTHTVTQTNPSSYDVTSGHTGNVYHVTTFQDGPGASCSCDWMKYRPVDNSGRCGCSHVLAVLAYIEAGNGRTIQARTGWAEVDRQHRQVKDIGDGLILTTRKGRTA